MGQPIVQYLRREKTLDLRERKSLFINKAYTTNAFETHFNPETDCEKKIATMLKTHKCKESHVKDWRKNASYISSNENKIKTHNSRYTKDSYIKSHDLKTLNP